MDKNIRLSLEELFGSLDILVEFEDDAKTDLIKFVELENHLSELLGVKVDLVDKTTLKPAIGKRILREVVY
ncbi:MAG: hypothetical protein QW358_05425, partial [Candidatus Hadarchaeum sp.]